MSNTRRHRKRRASEAHDLAPSAAPPVAAAAQPQAASRPIGMPDWKWKTFPVYFAFAVGGFLGMYTGVLGSANDGDYFTFIAIFWAVLLGFGFSRFSTRWIVSRQWNRRQARNRGK